MPTAMPPVNPLAVGFMLVLMGSMIGAWVWALLRFAFGLPILPRFEPKLVPWGGKSALAVILGWLAIQVGVQKAFVSVVQGSLVRPKGEPFPLSPAEMMTASALQNATVLVVIPLLLWATCRARPRDYYGHLGRKTGWQFLQGMVAWPLAAPVIYAMMLAAVAIWGRDSHPLETAIQNEGVGSKAVVFFLAGAVFAPAAEELIFRGVLLGWLTSLILRPRGDHPAEPAQVADDLVAVEPLDPVAIPHDEVLVAATPAGDLPETSANAYAPPLAEINARPWSDRAKMPAVNLRTGRPVQSRLLIANLLVSVLFAGLHYSVWPTPVPIFFLSLALGILYQRTGSLVAPTALHMTFNGVSTILMFLTIGMNPSTTKPPQVPIPAPIPRPVAPIGTPPVALLRIDPTGRS